MIPTHHSPSPAGPHREQRRPTWNPFSGLEESLRDSTRLILFRCPLFFSIPGSAADESGRRLVWVRRCLIESTGVPRTCLCSLGE